MKQIQENMFYKENQRTIIGWLAEAVVCHKVDKRFLLS